MTTKKDVKLVLDWNKEHPEGTAVTVRLDDGTTINSKTTSEAWLLGGHTAVVKLEAIHGAFALARVTAS